MLKAHDMVLYILLCGLLMLTAVSSVSNISTAESIFGFLNVTPGFLLYTPANINSAQNITLAR
jgi:hypothetical protein